MKVLSSALLAGYLLFPAPVSADLGDADFPQDFFTDGPSSVHDAWCRKPRNDCKILFRGPALWVAGQGRILSTQYIEYRYDRGRGEHSHENLFYNYLTYKSSSGEEKTALFVFANGDAQREFARSLFLWKRQVVEMDGDPELRPL